MTIHKNNLKKYNVLQLTTLKLLELCARILTEVPELIKIHCQLIVILDWHFLCYFLSFPNCPVWWDQINFFHFILILIRNKILLIFVIIKTMIRGDFLYFCNFETKSEDFNWALSVQDLHLFSATLISSKMLLFCCK